MKDEQPLINPIIPRSREEEGRGGVLLTKAHNTEGACMTQRHEKKKVKTQNTSDRRSPYAAEVEGVVAE